MIQTYSAQCNFKLFYIYLFAIIIHLYDIYILVRRDGSVGIEFVLHAEDRGSIPGRDRPKIDLHLYIYLVKTGSACGR